MALSGSAPRDQSIAEINIIPLCDVLLVLLIIFMVTAPALSYPVEVALPGAGESDRGAPPPVHLRIDATGQAYWDGQAVSGAELGARMRVAGQAEVARQPLLQIDASGDCEYQAVARVVAHARNAGLGKVRFVGAH